jgi:hypothetical protein
MRLIIEISLCAPTNLESGTKCTQLSRGTLFWARITRLYANKTTPSAHPPFKSPHRRDFQTNMGINLRADICLVQNLNCSFNEFCIRFEKSRIENSFPISPREKLTYLLILDKADTTYVSYLG